MRYPQRLLIFRLNILSAFLQRKGVPSLWSTSLQLCWRELARFLNIINFIHTAIQIFSKLFLPKKNLANIPNNYGASSILYCTFYHKICPCSRKFHCSLLFDYRDIYSIFHYKVTKAASIEKTNLVLLWFSEAGEGVLPFSSLIKFLYYFQIFMCVCVCM